MVAVRKIQENRLIEAEQAACPKCQATNYIDSSCSLVICDNCTNVFDVQSNQEKEFQLTLPFESDNIIKVDFSNKSKNSSNIFPAMKYIAICFAFFTSISFFAPTVVGNFYMKPSLSGVSISGMQATNTAENLLISATLNNQSDKTAREENLLLTTYDSTGKIVSNMRYEFDKKIKKFATEKVNFTAQIPSDSNFYSLQLISAK